MSRLSEAWSRLDWTVTKLIKVGDEHVFAQTAMRAEGRGSGMKLEGDAYHCLWLRHGRFFRVKDHLTLSGALHALRLKRETLEAVELRK